MTDAEFRALFRKMIESCQLPRERAEAVLQRILHTLAKQETISKGEEEGPHGENHSGTGSAGPGR